MEKYLKSISTYIPGFRSLSKVNIIIATIYYLLCISIFIISIFLGDAEISGLQVCVIGILCPFVIFSIMDRAAKNW